MKGSATRKILIGILNNISLQWRECWANFQNETFIRKGLEVRVSHENYKKRGIEHEPTKHLGPVLMAMERRDIKTKLGNENRAIEIETGSVKIVNIDSNWSRNKHAFEISR